MKKLSQLIIAFLLISGTMLAQTVTVGTYGVNPRQVAEDSTDIFDLRYNGATNVGIETQMYLIGSSSETLTGTTWTLDSKPATSTAAISAPTVIDTSKEVTILTPDVIGTYVVIFTEAGMADTLTINAGLYLGMESGTPNCMMCHSDYASNFVETEHAVATKKQFDALPGSSSHFGESCLECHATGYYPSADNDGFDDFPFMFPDTFMMGMYDSLTLEYPDAMARADVQCEACHGPGSEHNGAVSDSKMISSIDVNNCAVCHEDNGTHHYFPSQWLASGQDATYFDGRGFDGGHAVGAFVTYAGGRGSCAPCHSGLGYIQWDKEGKPTNSLGLPTGTEELPEAVNISCPVCHDPHDATEPYQLRLSDTQLGDGTPVTVELYGTGAQCMECHRSRRYAKEYASTPSTSPHYGPHHGPQADMLIGANYPDWPYDLPSSPHDVAGGDACVDCHMYAENSGFDADGNVILVGGHSFNMNDVNGVDHVAACEPCHGDVGTTFKEKKYYQNSIADHDGDGIDEGLQDEVHGMLEHLETLLDADTSLSPTFMRAKYAYVFVEEDRSFGIHNPAFTVAMLQVAIESMKYGAITAGNMVSVTDIPMDQGFQVRTVWTAFGADDGVAPDQVESYVVLRKVAGTSANKGITDYSSLKEIPADISVGTPLKLEGTLWDIVAEVPAVQFLEYSAVVPTLYNTVEGDTVWTTFKVLGKTEMGIIAETDPMSGYSTDDLAPAVPANLTASGTGVGIQLTWEESLEDDFKYYEIYRSETAGFVPTTSDIIATTIDYTFDDNSVLNDIKYYYVVTSVDFSNNISGFSNEASATLTDVGFENGTPTEYALNQNYPNPFNPSTMIKFAIPEVSNVRLTVFDITGQEIAVLVDREMSAGYYNFTWNASSMASGIYFYRLESGSFIQTHKMLLLK
ncbi:MAG: T9SS type A sorting domain-containing protein [Ignavibacteriae bacterium]|nr:T9SS C-terminal target domain-containing protein [Ignavibacteriota bacterium]NOG99422.1 T9SS type A sorting domain-containing protein [Ignavibacteriota bacterium]